MGAPKARTRLATHAWLLIGGVGCAGVTFFFTSIYLLGEPAIASHLGTVGIVFAWSRLLFGVGLLLAAVVYGIALKRQLLDPLERIVADLAWMAGGKYISTSAMAGEAVSELAALATSANQVSVHLRATNAIYNEAAEASLEAFRAMTSALTEGEAINRRLRESEEQFRALADAMPQIVWTALADGSVDYCNARWYSFTGLSVAESHGWAWDHVVHPDDRDRCITAWSASVASGQPYQVELRFRRASDGAYRWHLGRALPVRDAEGHILRWFGTNTDIEDFKHAQEMLTAANERLREHGAQVEAQVAEKTAELRHALKDLQVADRYKDEFLAVVSHELRTPLNFIMGFASLLQDTSQLTEAEKGYVGKILNGTDRMLLLVNDLLDFAKLRAGKFQLDPHPVGIAGLIDEAASTLRPLAEHKNLALEIGPVPPQPVLGDGQRLIQVLTNYLSNAIKFTKPGGSLHVSARLRGAYMVVEVQDTGIGIADADLPRLFKRFEQLDGSSTRAASGTGLGLAISEALVEAHGGQVGVRSKLGEGSTFWFSVPLDESAVREAP